MCYPQSWKRWQSNDTQVTSFVKGYTGDAGSSGVFLFTYFNPRQQPDEESKNRYLNEAVSFLANHNVTPHWANSQRIDNCAGYSSPATEMLTAFTNGSAAAVGRVGMEQDGLIHVAVVFDNSGGRLRCDTLMSVTNIFANNY
jgi:hypothetical protein